jgi:hypothetical protein
MARKRHSERLGKTVLRAPMVRPAMTVIEDQDDTACLIEGEIRCKVRKSSDEISPIL